MMIKMNNRSSLQGTINKSIENQLGALVAVETARAEAAEAALGARINDLEQQIDQKADASDLQALEQRTNAALDLKADNIICSATGETIAIYDSAERRLKSLKLYGKTVEKEKNFFPYDKAISIRGVITFNSNNTFTIPAYAFGRDIQITEIFTLQAGQYEMMMKPYMGGDTSCVICTKDGSHLGDTVMSEPFSLTESTEVYVTLNTDEGSYKAFVGELLITKLGVWEFSNVGDSGKVDVSISGSGHESQTLTVLTPNGLASVGDVCDEIDFEKGTYIQRISRGEEYTVLDTPVETPLSVDQLEAFKVLHTNYKSTYIKNDSGAMMTVEYVADTKTYIDNSDETLGNFVEQEAATRAQADLELREAIAAIDEKIIEEDFIVETIAAALQGIELIDAGTAEM